MLSWRVVTILVTVQTAREIVAKTFIWSSRWPRSPHRLLQALGRFLIWFHTRINTGITYQLLTLYIERDGKQDNSGERSLRSAKQRRVERRDFGQGMRYAAA